MAPETDKPESTKRARTPIAKYWHPELEGKTPVGFTNPSFLCYRNVAFQMLLHMPVFTNWVMWYSEHHAPDIQVCMRGQGGETCTICLFYNLVMSYWWRGNEEKWQKALEALSTQIYKRWKKKGEEGKQQEDLPEYLEHVYSQFKQDVLPMYQGDLEDIFRVEMIDDLTCEKHCKPTSDEQEQPLTLLQLALPGGSDGGPHSMVDLMRKNVPKKSTECEQCGGQRFSASFSTKLPEMLLVQVNRLKEDGVTKIEDQITLEDLVIDEEFNVEYELTSVILHHRESDSEKGGHYTILAKDPAGTWNELNDDKTTEEDLENWEERSRDSYVFAYRRLPLQKKATSNGPLITAEASRTPKTGADPNSTGKQMKDILKHITALFNENRAKDKDIWKEQQAERKKEWTEWADERDVIKKSAEEDKNGGTEGEGEEGKEIVVRKAYDGENYRGDLRVIMTDKILGTRHLDIQVRGLATNNLKNPKKRKDSADSVSAGSSPVKKAKGPGKNDPKPKPKWKS